LVSPSLPLPWCRRNVATRKSSYALKGEVYAIHNFHLVGPGLNKSTSVGGVIETTWSVRLKPGKYSYSCDAHAQMRGTFRVTS
jgi:plastocyanin